MNWERQNIWRTILKKFKHLVVGGCSFSKGGCMYRDAEVGNLSIDERWDKQRKNRFGNKLAKLLNIPEIEPYNYNLSRAGGSNDRMFRVLFDWVEENRDIVKDTLFVCGLTDTMRKDLYSVQSNEYIVTSEIWQDISWIVKELNCSPTEITTWRDFDLKYFTKREEIEKKIIRDCVLFDSLVGGNVIFFNAWRRSDIVHPKLKFLKINNKPGYVGYNWSDYILSYREEWDFGHPNEYDHKHMSELLYEYIKEIYDD